MLIAFLVVICVDPLPTLEYFDTSPFQLHDPFTPFQSLTPRGNTEPQLQFDELSLGEVSDIDEDELLEVSTKDSLLEWVNTIAGQKQAPQEGLLRRLLHDLDDLVMVIRASLDDIEEQSISLSPVQLQEHAIH